ncbi:hypothetical protein LSTR_LSTR012284 [Laodelphax striatellus]|uniref:G-protein coupled receptors family 3 profile domain-containing protein n=1 Tax=Laodelphax striatellus TaxID=195883 RepID=A0A482WMH2_LAOST|nr:hypothetical protein LSTR_LSTR012284 [Laodelphax striatellus]
MKGCATKIGFIISLILVLVSKAEQVCETSQSIISVPGNIHLAGIFDVHSGENCSSPVETGIEQATAALAVIKLLQEVNFLPGVRIGISLYDSCSSDIEAQKRIVSAKLESDCMDSMLFGVLTTAPIHSRLQPLAASLSLPTVATPGHSPPPPFLLQVAASLLPPLGWSHLDAVLASDSLLLDAFEEAAAQLRVCVETRRLLAVDNIIETVLTGKIVIIYENANLKSILKEKISSRAQVIVLPLQLDFDFQTADYLPSESYIIQPSHHTVKLTRMEDENSSFPTVNKTLENSLENTTDHKALENPLEITTEKPLDIFRDSLATPLFVQTAADLIQTINTIKTNIEAMCPHVNGDTDRKLCDNLKFSKQSIRTTTVLQSVAMTSAVLDAIEMESEGFELLRLVRKDEDDLIGSYSIIEGNWTWLLMDNDINSTQFCRLDPLDNSTGLDCSRCSNFKEIYRKRMEEIVLGDTFLNSIKWKTEPWVAVVITISVVGILCDLAIIVFITVRICKQDILEGNPTFSFLLLFAIIVTYLSSLPYSFDIASDNTFYSGIACNLRILGASLSYSFIFSIMLARSFMIASCDHDGGFMSHINGYLQTVVCFFIVLVQLALSFQFGALNWRYMSTENCMSLTHGHLFIFVLSYDMFLLLLLVFTAPFIMRTKRNYHEGSFFAVASVLCALAWCGWVTLFTILDEKYQDMVVSCGLCATSTIILVTVFIPRTYLMVTGIVRDHLASTLPSLAYASSTSVIDVINYRSTQALYDSVNPTTSTVPKSGLLNPNFYSDRPGTPSTSKMDSIQRIEHQPPENTYERYDTPTSPLNVTRF